MPARVPGVEAVLGQIELIDQVRDAAGMLVTAMKQNDRAFGFLSARGPVAIEKVDAVVRGKRFLFYVARGVHEGLVCDFNSLRPPRMRLTMVKPIATARSGSNGASQAGSAGVK